MSRAQRAIMMQRTIQDSLHQERSGLVCFTCCQVQTKQSVLWRKKSLYCTNLICTVQTDFEWEFHAALVKQLQSGALAPPAVGLQQKAERRH